MWFRTGASGKYCQQGTKIFASTKNGVLRLAKWLLFSEEGCCLVKSFSFLSVCEHLQTISFCSFSVHWMCVGLLLISLMLILPLLLFLCWPKDPFSFFYIQHLGVKNLEIKSMQMSICYKTKISWQILSFSTVIKRPQRKQSLPFVLRKKLQTPVWIRLIKLVTYCMVS